MEAAVADHEQGRQVKDAVAFHQAAIAAGVHPAQALDGQVHRGEMAPGPAARRAAFAGEYQQRNPFQGKQLPVGVQIGEFQGRHAADLDRKEEMGPDHHP